MMIHPPIIMSSLDEARISRLLESRSCRQSPGVEALMAEMERATVVPPNEVPPDVVTMNSTVRFTDDSQGREFSLTLVYPQEAAQPDTVSVLAPVGSALLGLSTGQTIQWQVPGGRTLNLRVLEILRQPEAMGELHR
jgi:regulator of nucleoside diphosphate kinase